MQSYDVWDVRKEREIVTGVYSAAASSGGASTIRLHDPIEYCIVTYVIKCSGDWPYIPSPESLIDDGYKLIKTSQIVHVPMPGGEPHRFSVSGLYIYVKEGEASAATSDMKSGVVPGDIGLTQEAAILKSAYYKLGLLQSNYFLNNPQYPPT